jgi:DNA ligase-1
MLAHNYKPDHYSLAGWYLSEKLDGQRALWDGGISRGILKSKVPYANTEKDERYLETQIATGLWSRYGNVIHAPDKWLDDLPLYPLDGELYGRIRMPRQDLRSITSNQNKNMTEWSKVVYRIFDTIQMDRWLAYGFIDLPNCHIRIGPQTYIWAENQAIEIGTEFCSKEYIFKQRLHALTRECGHSSWVCEVHPQEPLPFNTEQAEAIVTKRLEEVSEAGGEGLIARSPFEYWEPHRVHTMLKLKKLQDMEGTVIGYITGRETDKGSKLLGMMGALVLMLDNKQTLEISGFTDEERTLVYSTMTVPAGRPMATRWAFENPETYCPDIIYALHFPRGTRVTFKYRGLSKDGVPQEARYWRKHDAS